MTRATPLKITVIGSTGLVGRAAVHAGLAAGHEVRGTSRSSPNPGLRVDLRDVTSIRRTLLETTPHSDVVVLSAALSRVAGCEADPRATYEVNVAGSQAVIEAAAEAESKVVFLSSDYVFGDGGPHDERDEPSPMNEYGRQKLETERLVLQGPDNLVIRTCQVYGQDVRRANYVLSTIDRLVAGEDVFARADLFGTPTCVRDLADEVVALSASAASGIWHVAGPDFLSRFEVARRAAGAFGLDPSRVRPTEVPLDRVPRPRKAGLRSSRGRPRLQSIGRGLAALAETERSRLAKR